MSALLEIKDLHVAYGKVEAVRGVALTMQSGQIVTVIGPNGAGKTTLLAAAAGLLRSRGTVTYDGIDFPASTSKSASNMVSAWYRSGGNCSAIWRLPTIFCLAHMCGVATGPK